jgi:MFS family permease
MALEQSATGMALYTSCGIGLPMVLGTLLSGFFIELIGFRNLFGLFIVFALLSLLLSYLYRNQLADH